ALVAERDAYGDALEYCAEEAGADPTHETPPDRIAERALQAIAQLRSDYEAAVAERVVLAARTEQLETALRERAALPCETVHSGSCPDDLADAPELWCSPCFARSVLEAAVVAVPEPAGSGLTRELLAASTTASPNRAVVEGGAVSEPAPPGCPECLGAD